MRARTRIGLLAGAGAAIAAALVVAGWTTRSSAPDQITIGASIPISGPLAGFGSFVKWGYTSAVKDVNAKGGITVEGKKLKVKLILLDDKTDPNLTAANVDRLITKEKVDALLGSCTPALTNAGAVVADRARVPYVTGCDPLEAFRSVKKWEYAWDVFFWEPDLASAPFKTLKAWAAKTNRKVAIIHDNGPDGLVVGGKLWPMFAKQYGYTVAYKASFPVENTQFGSMIESAKAKGADIVLVDAVTPPAVAFVKQMFAADYHPKVLVIEKGAEPVQFAEALGKKANGVIVGGFWDPSFSPAAASLRRRFERETGRTFSQHIGDSYAVTQVLLDAIRRAGSLDKEKINQALARTNLVTVAGRIRFAPDHTAKLPIVELQWQNCRVRCETRIVWPRDRATGKLLMKIG